MKVFTPIILAALAGSLALSPAMAQTRTPLGDNTAATSTQQSAAPNQTTPPSMQTAPGQDPGTVSHGPSGAGAGSAGGK